MTSRTKKFRQIQADWDLWQKLYYKHPQAYQLTDLGIKEDIEVEFIHTPPYLPYFNLVEYLIHQLRLQLLHHQSMGITIELNREKIEQYLEVNQLQTPQQIQNTIAHICSRRQ